MRKAHIINDKVPFLLYATLWNTRSSVKNDGEQRQGGAMRMYGIVAAMGLLQSGDGPAARFLKTRTGHLLNRLLSETGRDLTVAAFADGAGYVASL